MTAVEWLLSELDKVNYHPTEAMVMYAKKLEKQQIIKAWEFGKNHGWNERENDYKPSWAFKKDSGQEYYDWEFNYKYGQLKK